MNVSKIDIEFSRYIRKKNANDDGVVLCYTCGVAMPWQQAECGHYIPRANMSTRFLEINCHPQCFKCNHELRGNIEIYRDHLLADYGKQDLEWLESLRNDTTRLLPDDLDKLYKLFKMKSKKINL